MSLDPRIEISNALYEVKAKISELEEMLWAIPHQEESYEHTFVAPTEGDYLHPHTPTHDKPAGFSDAAYWDSCCQAWIEPTPYEWDEYNYVVNVDTTQSYDAVANTWVEGDDWSNNYANVEYVATEFVESFDEGNIDMTDGVVTTAPVVEGEPNISYEEDAPMPTDMPVDAPMPTDMPETTAMHDEAIHMNAEFDAGNVAPTDGTVEG